MRILALEFSSRVRSAAVWDPAAAATVPAEAQVSAGRATPVFSLIEAALRRAGLDRTAIERIAVGLGPGSAMGIRTAIAVAQGWQLARDISVVGGNSLDVLAAGLQADGRRGRLHLVSDAQRGEWHVAEYDLTPERIVRVEALRLIAREELLRLLRAGQAVLGPDAATSLPGAQDAFPNAVTLARWAAQAVSESPPEALEPVNLRAPTFVKALPPTVPGRGAGDG